MAHPVVKDTTLLCIPTASAYLGKFPLDSAYQEATSLTSYFFCIRAAVFTCRGCVI